MVKRLDLMTPVAAAAICLLSLSTAVSADDDTSAIKKVKKVKETKTEAAAVKLFKTGRMVLPVIDAPDIATYLRALAVRAGAEAAQGYMSGKEWEAPAPAPARQAGLRMARRSHQRQAHQPLGRFGGTLVFLSARRPTRAVQLRGKRRGYLQVQKLLPQERQSPHMDLVEVHLRSRVGRKGSGRPDEHGSD